MEKISSENDLKAAILHLESKQTEEGKILKMQYLQAYESMKPINIIKSTFKEVSASPALKDELFNISVGLAAGYVSKILFQGTSHSQLRKLFGTVLMFGITNAVAKHPEVVKSVGRRVIKALIGKPAEETASLKRT
jgi:hypothetical protein